MSGAGVDSKEFTTLGAIVSRTGGVLQTGPFGSQLHASDYTIVGTPLVMPINLGDNEIRDTGIARVGSKDVRRLRRHALREGDIVFSRRGDVGRRSIVRAEYAGWLCGTGCLAARFGSKQDGVNPAYVAHYLGSMAAQTWLQDNAVGGTMPNLNTSILAGLPVRLPARADQDEIVTALGDAQDVIVQTGRLIAKKQSIKQGMIQQLITGAANAPGYSKDTWEERSLGQLLLRPPRYGINAAAVPLRPGVATYIRITDINDVGRFSPNPEVGVSHPNAPNYRLASGELVFARTGASVGKSYLYDPRDGELVYAGFLINVTPDPKRLNPRFLALYAQTKEYWDWVARTSVRTGQPGINGQEYAQLPIALPKIQTQNAIADALSDVDGEIDALGRRLEKAHMVKVGMMQQLLTGRTRLPAPEAAS